MLIVPLILLIYRVKGKPSSSMIPTTNRDCTIKASKNEDIT